MIPGSVYIYIGASAAKIIEVFRDKNSTLHKYETYLMIVGIVFLISVVTIIGYITKKELQKYIQEEEREEVL